MGGGGVMVNQTAPRSMQELQPIRDILFYGAPVTGLSCLQRSNVPTFKRSKRSDVPNRTERSHHHVYNLCAILAPLRSEDRSVPPSWRSS
jgi:hypothetical protein